MKKCVFFNQGRLGSRYSKMEVEKTRGGRFCLTVSNNSGSDSLSYTYCRGDIFLDQEQWEKMKKLVDSYFVPDKAADSKWSCS